MTRNLILICPTLLFVIFFSKESFAFPDSKYSVELLHPDFKTLTYDVAQAWGNEMDNGNDSIFCYFSGDPYFTSTKMWMLRVVDEFFVEQAIYNFNFEGGGVTNITVTFASIKNLRYLEDFWVPLLVNFEQKRVRNKYIWGELFDVCQETAQLYEDCFESRNYGFDKLTKHPNKSVDIRAKDGQRYNVVLWAGRSLFRDKSNRSPYVEFDIPHLFEWQRQLFEKNKNRTKQQN